jgi:hypothetical protein
VIARVIEDTSCSCLVLVLFVTDRSDFGKVLLEGYSVFRVTIFLKFARRLYMINKLLPGVD